MSRKPAAFARHSRSLGENLYVYAVLARRSGGVSVGVNLNPDKICNWDCVYCQVDRTTPPVVREVDLDRLREELELTLSAARSGELFERERFRDAPDEMKRLNDIAFAGDGEPTSFPRFDEAVRIAIEAKLSHGFPDLPVVVLTNATLLDRPAVRRGLDLLAGAGGEIWAKLDAGTEAYFRTIDRPHHDLDACVRLISAEARRRPVVIQALFCTMDGSAPPESEIEAWIERLRSIVGVGGRIRLVQITTVARRPAVSSVGFVPDRDLDGIADKLRAALPQLPVETYYGIPSPDTVYRSDT